MTNCSQRNFHVLTTRCPLELGQQILVFPVSDKFLMIVYLKVCLFRSLSALPNWKTSFPIELGHHIQSAYCYFCLEGDPRGSVPVLPLKDSLIRTGKSLRGHVSWDCTGQDCPRSGLHFSWSKGINELIFLDRPCWTLTETDRGTSEHSCPSFLH